MKLTVAPTPHLRRAGLVVTIASLAAIALATLLPEPSAAVGSLFCLVCGSAGGVSAVLNVLLFAPLGIGLALAGIPGRRALLAMWALSALIEAAQFLVIPGRYSTIGDVLTNSLGGALGFAIGRYAPSLLRPPPRVALALGVGWSAVWIAIQTISAFGFSPVIPRSEYYGQIARQLGDFEQFSGAVIHAYIGDVTVSDARLPDSHRVRQLLLGGAIVTTTIVPARRTGGIAPIIRLADTGEREIVLIAQADDKLVFGVRTGAAVLRLRPPAFALGGAFPAASPSDSGLANDTLRLSARYSEREVWVGALGRMSRERRFPVAASLGWTMFLPFQWFIEGTPTEHLVSAIWIAAFMLPIGYWGVCIIRFRRAHNVTPVWLAALPIAVAILYVGLVSAPLTFGVAAASAQDWLAALVGILSGGALATKASVTSQARLPSIHTLPSAEGS